MEGYYLDEKGTQYIEEFDGGATLRVTLFYGSYRQYAICNRGVKVRGDKKKAISAALKECREHKKYVTPTHGCTEYI